MGDLFNNFPSWGETGKYPASGFFYEGGDQVNEKHMDALWNGVKTHIDNLNEGIRDRIRDISGDVVLDQGLVASTGSGTREVDVTASSAGAYVDGQKTGSTSATTLTHTANGGGFVRTDSVWVNTNGTVGKTEGTTTVASDRHKIAEVDVDPNDTITAVRNYGRDHRFLIASESALDSPEPGDLWQDLTNKREKVYQNGDWRTLVTEEDDVTLTAGDGLDGSTTIDLVGGGTFNPSVDVTDLLGTGIAEDGSNNLELNESVIKDGGAKEIDAQEFAGSDGTTDQVLSTDGSNAQWVDIQTGVDVSDSGALVVDAAGNINFASNLDVSDDGDGTVTVNSPLSASETNDGSDITEYVVPQSTSGSATLLDVSGSGIFLGGLTFQDDASSSNTTGVGAEVTVDGGSTYNVTSIRHTDGNSDDGTMGFIPPVKFESSLQINVYDWDNGNYISGHGWIKF